MQLPLMCVNIMHQPILWCNQLVHILCFASIGAMQGMTVASSSNACFRSLAAATASSTAAVQLKGTNAWYIIDCQT